MSENDPLRTFDGAANLILMGRLSLDDLLRERPDVGWLDLPLPPGTQIALFLDDEELMSLHQVRSATGLPASIANSSSEGWKYIDPNMRREDILKGLYEDHTLGSALLIGLGDEVLGYMDIPVGNLLLIYEPAIETDLEQALGSSFERRQQHAAFRRLLRIVERAQKPTGDMRSIQRAKELLAHFEARLASD